MLYVRRLSSQRKEPGGVGEGVEGLHKVGLVTRAALLRLGKARGGSSRCSIFGQALQPPARQHNREKEAAPWDPVTQAGVTAPVDMPTGCEVTSHIWSQRAG